MSASFSAFLYLLSSVCFIMALRGLSSPKTSRMGNIYGISGMIYNLDKNECVSIQKSIIKSLEKDNPTAIKDIEDFDNLDYLDKSGESIANGIYLDFPSGDTFSVECYLYGKTYKEKNNYKDHIRVSIETKENREFIQNEAYN